MSSLALVRATPLTLRYHFVGTAPGDDIDLTKDQLVADCVRGQALQQFLSRSFSTVQWEDLATGGKLEVTVTPRGPVPFRSIFLFIGGPGGGLRLRIGIGATAPGTCDVLIRLPHTTIL